MAVRSSSVTVRSVSRVKRISHGTLVLSLSPSSLAMASTTSFSYFPDPSTLIVPTNELKDLRQANMIYGPVQNAVAQAIVDKLAAGIIPAAAMHADVMFVQAAVHPQALDRRVLHHNAYTATCAAIDGAFGG